MAGLPILGRDLGRFRDWRGCLRVPGRRARWRARAMLGLQVSRDGHVLVLAVVGDDLLPVPGRASVLLLDGREIRCRSLLRPGSVRARPCWCASLAGSTVMRRAGRTGFVGAAIGR